MIFKAAILMLAPLLYIVAYQEGYNHGYDAGGCNATRPWSEHIACWQKLYEEMKK